MVRRDDVAEARRLLSIRLERRTGKEVIAMEHKRITCPKTAHLEEIDFDPTPCGVVIAGCSRFEPRHAVECERECARRMDRRGRRDLGDRAERVLVVFAHEDASTRSIAEVIAGDLARDRLCVELADSDARTAPPPADYEAVVIGSRVRFGRFAPAVIEYIVRHRDALAAMPAFFFVVGNTSHPERLEVQIAHRTGWHPTVTTAFAAPLAGGNSLALLRFSCTQPERPFRNADWVHDFAMNIADAIPELARS
jgi:menaquinone-dependent protoporphyrinogen oxidase